MEREEKVIVVACAVILLLLFLMSWSSLPVYFWRLFPISIEPYSQQTVQIVVILAVIIGGLLVYNYYMKMKGQKGLQF